MLVYIIGTVLSLFFAFMSVFVLPSTQMSRHMNSVLPKIFAFVSFVPLMIIMAFRKNVGTDFQSYVNIFQNANLQSYVNIFQNANNMEIGYAFLNKILHSITDNPQIIFIVSAIIICGCFFFMIYKESINPVYSILLFVLCRDYFIAMNCMRQYIATAIVILAIPFVKKEKWVKAAFVFLVAFLFHRSVVVFLLMFVIYKLDIKPLIGIVVFAGVFFFSGIIVKYLLFPLLSSFNLYVEYFPPTSTHNNLIGDFDGSNTIIFSCFFAMLAFEYKNVQTSKELKLMYSGVLTSLIVLATSSVMPALIYRITWYMNSQIILYTPLAVKSIRDQNRKLGIFLEIAIPIAYALITIPKIINGEHGVLPYYSVLF